ncbi:MAG: hypothetical protein FWH40_07100 [Coriobacteriia bacterium]|nr:hypothetical protein [Coriobacteriia bacterium]
MCIINKAMTVLMAAVLLVTSASGCQGSSNDKTGYDTQSLGMVIGVSYESQYCIGSSGLVYIQGHTMKYYDFEASQSYVMCNKPNCRHTDDSCVAYCEDRSISGLALYGGRVYYFENNYDNWTLDLYCMDLSGENREIVMSMDKGLFEPGSWMLNGVETVFYTSGSAWLVGDYQYNNEQLFSEGASRGPSVQSKQLTSIDLASGLATDYFELDKEGRTTNVVQLATDGILVLQQLTNPETMLNEQEFYDALEKGEFPEFENDVPQYGDEGEERQEYSYFEYLSQYALNQSIYSITLLDMANGSTSILFASDCPREEFGIHRYYVEYYFCGIYEERLIYTMHDPNAGQYGSYSIYAFDTDARTSDFLYTIEDGYISFSAGQGNCVTAEGDIIFNLATDDGSYDVYRYSLATETSKHLFRIAGENYASIMGEVGDCFILRSGSIDIELNTYTSMVSMIPKTDYLAGNLEAAWVLEL